MDRQGNRAALFRGGLGRRSRAEPEAQVLAYLRSREGQAVERAALLRDVWGYEWTGGSNVVEVVVSSLRRKLGDDAGTIATVRGVGYRYGRASSTMLNGVSAARRT